MIIIYNGVGVLCAILGFTGAFVAGQLSGTGHTVAITVVGTGVAALADLLYRLSHHEDEGGARMLIPSAGGHVWYIPIWILAGVIAISALRSPTDRPEPATGVADSSHEYHIPSNYARLSRPLYIPRLNNSSFLSLPALQNSQDMGRLSNYPVGHRSWGLSDWKLAHPISPLSPNWKPAAPAPQL